MSLHRLADEGQHGFERQALLKDPSAASSGHTHRLPQQVHPEIDPDKGQGDIEQPQHRILGGRADAGLIFDAVAGFNPEAISVVSMHLEPSHVGPIDDIEPVLNAMLSLRPLTIATDHDHRAGDAAIVATAEGVGGLIAASPLAEGTGAARFAPDHGGHDEREFQGHSPANHRHAVKAPVEIEPLHLHDSGANRVESAGDHGHRRLFLSDGVDRQGDPPMRPNPIHRGLGKEGRGACFGLRAIDIGRFRLTRLTVVGQPMQVDG